MTPTDALSIYCQLSNEGMRLAREVSLISLFEDLFVSSMIPELSRYSYNHANHARVLSRMVITLATSHLRPTSKVVIPEFVRGATVGRAMNQK